MSEATPVVYLLHGEDEFSVAQYVSELEQKLGDAVTASMNVTRLDGRTFNLDDLLAVAGAMPFMAKRRLVILTNPTARLTTSSAQEKFLQQLSKLQSTTALVLVEHRSLTEDRERRKGRLHWLEKWAVNNPDRAFVRIFPPLRGAALEDWILKRTRTAGGQLTNSAARSLSALVGDDPRQADQEIEKLLAYVNYARPVEAEDVAVLTIDSAEGNIFEMVDALGNRDGRQATAMLHRLLEEQEPISILGMIIRQYRLLILSRELIDTRRESDAGSVLKIYYRGVLDKLFTQARRFSIQDLESVYRDLLEIDLAIKSGEIEPIVALDSLFARLAAPR